MRHRHEGRDHQRGDLSARGVRTREDVPAALCGRFIGGRHRRHRCRRRRTRSCDRRIRATRSASIRHHTDISCRRIRSLPALPTHEEDIPPVPGIHRRDGQVREGASHDRHAVDRVLGVGACRRGARNPRDRPVCIGQWARAGSRHSGRARPGVSRTGLRYRMGRHQDARRGLGHRIRDVYRHAGRRRTGGRRAHPVAAQPVSVDGGPGRREGAHLRSPREEGHRATDHDHEPHTAPTHGNAMDRAGVLLRARRDARAVSNGGRPVDGGPPAIGQP